MAANPYSPARPARLLAAIAISVGCAAAQSSTLLREVRYWSSLDATRIAIETTQDVEFEHGELTNPHRLFVDLKDVQPRTAFKGLSYTIPVEDGVVKQIRVAPNKASVTRVVLDLAGPVTVTTGKLVNPPRIVIDVRRAAAAPDPVPVALPVQVSKQPIPTPPSAATKTPAIAAPPPTPPKAEPPIMVAKAPVGIAAKPEPIATKLDPLAHRPEPPAPKPEPPGRSGNEQRTAQAARLVTPSLTRALGLKLRRVVLDAGHGGIDPGSDGPTGLVEKELLLDITLRLGKLIEERTDLEVLYTRKDDTFVDLHERAPFANRAKGDLFLSIHANTAPVKSVVGAETYYLNRGESKEDLAVATRENATSGKSLYELGDLVKQIVAYDKRDESRQFATHIQAATHDFAVQTFGRMYNRGVRHAPFAVLIGATMPAVLVEVGFISNPKEEALLKKSEHRQKMAEALYKGIMSYANSLSHYSLAQAED